MMTTQAARLLLLVLCTLLGHAGVQGQVVRCTDARTGKVTYTDGKCDSGSSALQVQEPATPEQIQREREQATQALERKRERQQADAEAERYQRQADLQRQSATGAGKARYAQSPACANARKARDAAVQAGDVGTLEYMQRLEAAERQIQFDCLGPDGYADVERARAAAQPGPIVVVPQPYYPVAPAPRQRPPQLTHCNEWRCFDTLGNSYPRAGPGRLQGPLGTCRSNGGQAPC